jgi:hypothetical protein
MNGGWRNGRLAGAMRLPETDEDDDWDKPLTGCTIIIDRERLLRGRGPGRWYRVDYTIACDPNEEIELATGQIDQKYVNNYRAVLKRNIMRQEAWLFDLWPETKTQVKRNGFEYSRDGGSAMRRGGMGDDDDDDDEFEDYDKPYRGCRIIVEDRHILSGRRIRLGRLYHILRGRRRGRRPIIGLRAIQIKK